MTAWALYVVAVSVLLSAAARAAEAALSPFRVPVRWVWAFALAGSLAAPFVFAMRPVATVPSGAPAALGADALTALLKASEPGLLDRLDAPAAVDRVVEVAWLGSAGLALLLLGTWFVGVGVAPRRWPRTRVDDEDVRVAPAAGPAVFGLLRPSIVVPRWLLECPAEVRRLALQHEREHVAARDPALLAAGALLAAVTPWNPVSWWLLARLRAAVELDCDRRVLRRGASVHAYGAMLLGIAGRTTSPRMAVALVEPAALLERRIRAMTEGRVKGRLLRGLACGGLCGVAVLVACSMDGPTSPAPADGEEMAKIEESSAAGRGGRVEAVLRAKEQGVLRLRAKEAGEIRELPSKEAQGLVRLRKGGTVSMTEQPLIYIDGVRVSGREMDELSPDAIDRIEVVKGALAARLAGERGSNGVIQIYTKKR